MRIDANTFLREAQRLFAFLLDFGFNVKRAEPDETGCRGEDVLDYQSSYLALMLLRSSWDSRVWCIVGRPNQNYPSSAVRIEELLEEASIAHTWQSNSSASLDRMHEIAAILKKYFPHVLSGDLTLLERIWEKRNLASAALDDLQCKLAYKIEVHPGGEILELPNTPEALGKEYIERFPDHAFIKERIWLVKCGLGEFYCDDYASALDLVQGK